MATMPELERPDAVTGDDAELWRDEDLAEILALLGDAPQPPQPVFLTQEEQEQPQEAAELPDEETLFDRGREEQPEAAAENSVRKDRELPDLRNLISFEEEEGKQPRRGLEADFLSREHEAAPAPTPSQEYVPEEHHRVGTGEQPDFSEGPVKKEWSRKMVYLGLLTVVELAVLAAVLIVFSQWIK